MTTLARHAFGVFGAIAFGTSALLTFLEYTLFRPIQIVARRPIIRSAGTDSTADSDSADVDGQVAEKESAEDVAVRSVSESNLRYKVELLDRGVVLLKSAGGYTAKLQKQEVVRGDLLDEQTMSIKCRHKPFSVYLLWLSGDTGREVLYIDGCHDGKMIAHDGGWKARLPAFSMATDGYLAMRDARYPVTLAGLEGLIDMMRTAHLEDLARSNFESCELDPHGAFAGRPCYVFTTKYKSPADSPSYRKSVTCIDCEWNVPIHSRHFEWTTSGATLEGVSLDEATLVEAYSFTELAFCHTLTDRDFDRANPEYHFR